MSKPSPIDPERLAALLEGKLSASEAAAVRGELANADPETIASYADAVAVAAELGFVHETPRHDNRQRSWVRWSVLGLAAAVLAFAALRLGHGGDDEFSATRVLASLPATVTVPASEAWPARRGAGDDMPSAVRAARLGVTLVDFELAVRNGDTNAVRRIASSIITLSSALPGTVALVAPYQAYASGDRYPRVSDPGRDSVNSALADVAGQRYVNAGAAGEAVRAAALSGDSSSIARVCNRSTDLRRALSVSLQPADAVSRDSLLHVLGEKSCSAAQVRAFSSAFVSSLTR